MPPVTGALSRLLDRDRFAGHHRLVDGRRALEDDAVDRDSLTRTDAQAVTHDNVLERNIVLGAIGLEPPCSLRRQPEQIADRRARPAARTQFENLAEQHEDDDDRGGFEVDGHFSSHAEGVGKETRCQCSGDAVDVCGAHAKRDEREHVEIAADDRRPASLEERPSAPEHDRSRESELDPIASPVRDEAIERTSGQELTNHERQDGHGERERREEASRHVHQFGIALLDEGDVNRLEGHAADRTHPGAFLAHLRMHRAGVFGLEIDRSGRACARVEELLRVLAELLEATLGAEVVRPPLVVEVPNGVGGLDGHPAHGIDDAFDWFYLQERLYFTY